MQNGVQLDLNLEKGRLKEDTTNLSQSIKDTHNRIETEVYTQYSGTSLIWTLTFQ